jgi:acyl-CoA synthetase (AMP-forming)/AMP-acid ligase II
MSLLTQALETPEKPAVIVAETGASLSFRALNERSIQLARVLRSHLSPGDRVALLMDNGLNFLVAAWAGQRSGLRYVPINWHLVTEEAAYIVTNSDAKALIASPRLAEVAEAVAVLSPELELLYSEGEAFGAFEPLEEALKGVPPVPATPEREGAPMLYSSGTTGKPKGILSTLMDEPFGANRKWMEGVIIERFKGDANSIYYGPAPLYHAAPLGWGMAMHGVGATVVIAGRFDAEAALKHLQDYRVTHAQFVPTHFVRMLKLPEEVRRKYDLSSLKAVVHAGAPCPVEVKEKMIEWLGPVVYEYYGQSEGGGWTMITPQEWLAHKGSVGRSLTGAIHIADDDGKELPIGETGHIYFESTMPAFKYHKDAAKTEEFFDRARGWRRPGDMGWVDAEGYLYLADRASHMIISGGVNIYPQEIESILTLHPAVSDVAVIGVPDPEYGESVKAVIEPAPGVETGDALAQEIIAFCRARLAGFKCPKSVDFTDDLPRLPSGKLLKRELRKRYWGDKRGLA